MICTKYKIYFGLFALAFLSFFSFSSVSALESYSFDVTSAPTHIYDKDQTSPFSFVPKYLLVDIVYTGAGSCPSNFSPDRPVTISTDFDITGAHSIYSTNLVRRCGADNILIDLTNYVDKDRFLYFYVTALPTDYKLSLTFYDDFPFSTTPAPSGSIDITENGTYDVSNYATAEVNVPQTSVNPYHDDLVDIKIGIYVVAGTLLVIYFFYCIYRMIIKSGGGWR